MNELIQPTVSVLGYLTLFTQFLIVFLVVLLVLPKKKNGRAGRLYSFFKENALNFAFLAASAAALGSLFLSEIVGFPPCKLCWWQRIFMYPSAIILFIALIKNDKGVVKYVLPLSLIGAGIAVYHYVIQLFPNLLECSEEVAKCSAIQLAQFGYITIPVMSLTAFLLVIVFLLYLLKK